MEKRRDKNLDYKMTSIIIVTYKALEYVKMCINSIVELTTVPYELIIVDNNSGPEMIEYLRTLKFIKRIENSGNRLLTPAQNQGLSLISSDSHYVLFLNPDVQVIHKNWLQLMIDRMERPKNIGIVGPICNYHPVGPLFGNIDMACLLTRRQILEESGGLDENYPWNGAGYAFTAFAWSRGWKYSHLKRPKIVKHFKSRSREFNKILNREIDVNKILRGYNIEPFWSFRGLLRQLYYRPETLWQTIRTKLK